MSIPTENVGSLPRPLALQHAIPAYDRGKITQDQLRAEQNIAAQDCVQRMEATGTAIVSDGEQRAPSIVQRPGSSAVFI